MKRIFGMGEGSGVDSRIWWIVGTAVYQLHLVVVKSSQNLEAANLGGMTMLPRLARGESSPHSNP